MRKISAFAWVVASVSLVQACLGAEQDGNDSIGDEPTGNQPAGSEGDPVGANSPAANSPNAGPSPLAGTWDVLGRDSESSLTIEVGNNSLTIEHQVHPYEENRFTVESTLSGFWLTHDNTYDEGYFFDDDLSYEEVSSHSAVANRAATHPMDLGWFPLDVSGTWEIKAGDVTCQADLSDTNGSLDCGPGPVRLAGVELSGTLAFSKASNAASKFGGLGGEWRASGNGRQCDITVAEDIRISCPSSNGHRAIAVTLSVSEDTVSGTSSDGVEFSAFKR